MHGQGSAPVSLPLGLCSIAMPMCLLDYLVLFHKKVMVRHWEHSKHLYTLWYPPGSVSPTTFDTANVWTF